MSQAGNSSGQYLGISYLPMRISPRSWQIWEGGGAAFSPPGFGIAESGAGREANQVREIGDRVNTWMHMRGVYTIELS